MTKLKINVTELLKRATGYDTINLPATIDIDDILGFHDTEDPEIDICELLRPHKTIVETWSAADLQEAYDWLTEDEAFDVLLQIEDRYDANIGISWELITATVESMYPEEDRRLQRRIERCRAALDAYDSNVVDILADLRHYCDAEDADFAALNELAHGHYLSERE